MSNKEFLKPILLVAIIAICTLMLSACGGGSGGDDSPPSTILTYSIGGTVSGLASGSLVLQNNGSDDLTITANGGFTFSSQQRDAETYAVTVSSQPAGLTCSVSNATGLVSNGNITNVAVVCATTSHSVGGSVTGLSGSVILQNNGGDDQTISADGLFFFSDPVAEGAGYDVTVKTQPLGQNCIVTGGGTGTIASADVTDVTLECGVGVTPLYRFNGANWNDYIRTHYGDSVCDAATSTDCTNGGERRVALITTKANCTDLTATDALDVFNWTCDDSTGTVYFSSTLQQGKGLVDLIDFDTVAWKDNSLTIYEAGNPIITTSDAAWWNNPIIEDNDGGTLDASGTIYILTTDATGATYTIAPTKIAFVGKPGTTIIGPGSHANIITVGSSVSTDAFLWLEGLSLDTTGDWRGIYFNSVRFSMLRNLNITGVIGTTAGFGIHLTDSSRNTLSNILVTKQYDNGVRLDSASNYNTLEEITASENGYEGIYLSRSTNNTLRDIETASNSGSGIILGNVSRYNRLERVRAHNNAKYGIYLSDSSTNKLADIVASNNGNYGVDLDFKSTGNVLERITASNNKDGIGIGDSSHSNQLTTIVASNNAGFGIAVGSSSSNKISEVVASNNGAYGVFLSGGSSNSLSNAALTNNYHGVYIYNTSNTTMMDVAATENEQYGVYLENSSNGYFTGLFMVGSNAVGNCYVTGTVTDPGIDDDVTPTDVGTESPEIHSGLCTQQGTSDFVTAITGTSLAASFVGKVIVDDTTNTSDSNGYAASYPADPTSFDWTSFDNSFRGWGVDGSAFPNPDHNGIWLAGPGRIWDWALNTADTVLKGAHASLPTGDDLLYGTTLRWAVEIIGDGIGNDNIFCESDETCIFTPNIGAYQGHGPLVSAGTFTDGTVTGVTLMKYDTNGY